MMDSLIRLQGLHADLVAFTETRLANIDRLWLELEESIHDFRRLLDKATPSACDKEVYNNGKISVGDQQYSINEDFKHISRAIATTLDLDEIEAGRLLIENQADTSTGAESLVIDAVSNYHNRRDLLLQCLRITLQHSLSLEADGNIKQLFETIVTKVLEVDGGVTNNGSLFARKCLNTLEDIEKLQNKVVDALQSKAVLGGPRGPEFYATLEFQRDSLFKQHEALASILAYLFQGDYPNQEDLRKLHAAAKRWNHVDFNLIHYLPAFSAAFRQFGSPGSQLSPDSTHSLDNLFAPLTQNSGSALVRPFHATLSLWWTVEYSGQFRELTDQDAASEKRGNTVNAALKEDSLEFMLAICTSTNLDVWRHPARQELVTLLLSESSSIVLEGGDQTSSYFRLQFMECLENFVEAFISNMPDSIRKLRTEEDDQRLNHLMAMQEDLPPEHRGGSVSKLHLECFLVLVSFAFEQRPEAAEQWWEDPDSNLYGFLQWASRRQTVPRVSAFCELLCSISEDQECAEAAHKFLLDDSLPSTRGRRNPSMNYQQIFAELELYAHKVHERSNPSSQLPNMRKVPPTEMNELESPVMLSCYLRLLAHLSRQPSGTRFYILQTAFPSFPQALLLLSSGPVPSYLRASIFATLDALLTDKSVQTATTLWQTLDNWAANGQEMVQSAVNKTAQPPRPTLTDLQANLNAITLSFDQCDSFVVLLRDLVTTSPSTGLGTDMLPFPGDLGSAYRSPGIDPYIDLVCGQVFVKRLSEVGDEVQRAIGAFHCLEFVAVGLEGFNEDYVVMMDRANPQRDASQETSMATAYAQRSAFARLMQWILSTDMNKALMESLRVRLELVETAIPDSPLLLSLQRSIDIVNRVLDLQPTYFDIVRPMVQSQAHQQGPFNRSSVNSIEDTLAAHPEVVLNLCQFAATDLSDLALRALSLLQKLSSSPKLNNHFLTSDPVRGRTRRIIDMLGPNASVELEPVAKNLAARLQFDIRDLEDGFESVNYLTKDGILAFLNACLETQPDLPNIAHLLLGFSRLEERLTISNSIDAGISVFNSIVDLVQNYPDEEDGVVVSWLVHIKAAALRVLRQLWSSSLSQSIVIGQLRRLQFLQSQYLSQPVIYQQTLWDGNTGFNPAFWYSTSAEALAEFLAYRASLFNYTTAELRAAAAEGLSTTLRQAFSILQGKTVNVDGTVTPNPDVFAFFDFLELDLSASFDLDPKYYMGIDFDMYLTDASDRLPPLYDIKLIREHLYAYRIDLLRKQLDSQSSHKIDEQDLIAEADSIIATIEARNRSIVAHKARSDALHEYVEMIIAIIESCPMDSSAKLQFILHVLQIMLPKLDVLISDESQDVLELARAADALLFSLSETAPTNTQMDNVITEKLFQLFRASIEGIPVSNSNSALRTIFYSICSQYLTRIALPDESALDTLAKARRNSMDCVRSASQRLIPIISDDAEDGLDSCRLNALNLLALLTSLARTEKSNYIVQSFVKANVLEILLESLKHVAVEFQEREPAHRFYLLSAFESRMVLLLQISRTRDGAGALLDAGLMNAVRDSLLFRADPDLGISFHDLPSNEAGAGATDYDPVTSALRTYYALLSSTLRVLLSTFFSRGAQNEQIQYLARSFLTEYRPNMVGIFKKYAGINGKVDEKLRPLIAESVRCYTGFVTLCGFVDFEDESGLDATQYGRFS
ncbi:nucleoporin Nup186/Nup192/Nup205 [Exophiala viscosa]|uniref:nucleoporin Nup186/Nup192/Nup205 n=1 Tax=Exophiala viscosa TaxID=2486360 RepID=UPI00219E448C|nr:nucleoporin Nup186/Nup192/Nup205 [Exophiala viscosa]